MVNISKAYLILELPVTDNSKDFSPSRFEDKEVSFQCLMFRYLMYSALYFMYVKKVFHCCSSRKELGSYCTIY
jgi:hypothetical protein